MKGSWKYANCVGWFSQQRRFLEDTTSQLEDLCVVSNISKFQLDQTVNESTRSVLQKEVKVVSIKFWNAKSHRTPKASYIHSRSAITRTFNAAVPTNFTLQRQSNAPLCCWVSLQPRGCAGLLSKQDTCNFVFGTLSQRLLVLFPFILELPIKYFKVLFLLSQMVYGHAWLGFFQYFGNCESQFYLCFDLQFMYMNYDFLL